MKSNSHQVDPLRAGLENGVDGVDSLMELALDMRWSWNHGADHIWKELDSELWHLTHNPLVVLQTVSRVRLEEALGDPAFRRKVDDLVTAKRRIAEEPAWFQLRNPESPLKCVAYFSMEFMLSEALPIYSGGLGNVAGDQLKSASDLGVPVVGVGLLYQQGYFRQVIGEDGVQQALYPYNDPGQLPISPLREADGEWLRLEIKLPGYSVWLRAWQVRVGRVNLYLLDSNDAANFPAHRGITSELYGGDEELRFKQELILGIGGWRLLKALGIEPQVCHLNEGHAAFAILERAADFMKANGKHFEAALAVTRAGNLFTTHTAVPAGFDQFSPELIRRYLGGYAISLGITVEKLLGLGRLNPLDETEPFHMAYLAMRGCGAANGVSELHGKVSRRIFSRLFTHWPTAEVPVDHVTNGIHVPSWDSAVSDHLWTEACGKERWTGTNETLGEDIRRVPAADLWQMRTDSRQVLVDYARRRLARELAVGGASPEAVEAARHLFDPNTLTLGFARRFVSYKRPNLLLHDTGRLAQILTNAQRPVQLIIAGKAHPADTAGQRYIREWVIFIRQPGIRAHVVFLSDYDMLLTEHMVQGVDVWLNTPRRPWEASGTSGMKVLVNGGLNLSALDGWWAEAYAPDIGWAFGDRQEHSNEAAQDAHDAEMLYKILEQQVIPEFYKRDANGIPAEWVGRMRESMARLTPLFSANRSVREYVERFYLPGALAYEERSADHGTFGDQIVAWQRDLQEKWDDLRFGEVTIQSKPESHHIEVQVFLDELGPDVIRLELYADAKGDLPQIREEMTCLRGLVGSVNGYLYGADVPADRLVTDFTPRIVPYFPGASVPLEAAPILWQK